MVKHALVIDDEKPLRDIVSKVLEHMDISYHTAASGDKAISYCREHHASIDLIILDFNMPGKDGNETYAEMLNYLNGTEPIVFMSGYDLSDSIKMTNTKARWTFLQKPFTISALKRAVNDVLAPQNQG